MTIEKCKTAVCVFCSSNPSVKSKSDYWLQEDIKIKGVGTGLTFGGICKTHLKIIGEKYLKLKK